MRENAIHFFYKLFAKEQMNFLYTGTFNDDHTERFIELNNHQFESGDKYKTMQRRAAFLIAECFQNIVRHSDLANQDSYFHIKNNFGVFSLISGNTISNKVVPSLRTQIEQLNRLTINELNEEYRKVLFDGQFSNKGGAGLGLIEMARKTKNNLNFRFSKINATKSYFFFQLMLNSIAQIRDSHNNDLDEDALLKQKMKDENLSLVYQGVSSANVTKTLLQIIEGSIECKKHKKAFIALMLLTENLISNSSTPLYSKQMTLLIGNKTNDYSINCAFELGEYQTKKLKYSYKNVHSDLDQTEESFHLSQLKTLIANSDSISLETKDLPDKNSLVNLSVKFKIDVEQTLFTEEKSQQPKLEIVR